MNDILTEQHEQVFEIILNRPERKNMFLMQTLKNMAEAVILAENTPNVRAIILRGAGKSFCAGIDVFEMGGIADLFGENWSQRLYEVTRLYQNCINRLQESTLPTIALLHKHTLGGGLEIALGCDIRIAAENAIISLEEARLGMIPDGGGMARLTHLIGSSRTKELIFTGRRIDAQTAEKWGLINAIVPESELLETGRQWAAEIASNAPLAISAAKRSVNAIENAQEGFYLEMVEQYPLFQSADMQEALSAAMQRRKPNWQGK